MLAYLSLFASGFIAATLFPASSEALLLSLQAKGYQPALLFIAALTGNSLGACVNWYLGYRLQYFQNRRWFPVSEPALARARHWFNRFGSISMLFSWLPVVGDPLTLVAGVVRMRFWLFLPLMVLGKALRYGALIWLGTTVFAN